MAGHMTDEEVEDEAVLIAYLQERDVPCPRCGYNLRRLTNCVCPECGIGLSLGVSAREPYLWPWIVAVVAAAGTAAIGLLFGALMLSKGLPGRSDSEFRVMILVYVAVVWTPIPLIVWRRGFLKRPRTTQIWIAICVAVAALVLFLLLATSIR